MYNVIWDKGYNLNTLSSMHYYKEYIKKFWVGLMDGIGNIQINRQKNRSVDYRLIIKLCNIKLNYKMLVRISKVIGGTILITDKGKSVIWLASTKEEIVNILKIYDVYPPMTHDINNKLKLLKSSLIKNTKKTFFNKNINLYKQLPVKAINTDLKMPSYFKEWLSGYIEAKGSFLVRNCNNHSFLLKEIKELCLMQMIKEHFSINNKIKYSCNNAYFIETYNREVLLKIINHCFNYPLLGEKLELLKKFSLIL